MRRTLDFSGDRERKEKLEYRQPTESIPHMRDLVLSDRYRKRNFGQPMVLVRLSNGCSLAPQITPPTAVHKKPVSRTRLRPNISAILPKSNKNEPAGIPSAAVTQAC